MHFAALIWKNVARRPSRSVLTLVALTTAIGAVVALLGIARGFTRSFQDIYSAHSVDLVVSRQGSADRLSSSVEADFAERIAQLPAVQRAAGVLLETLSLEEQGIYGVACMGIAQDSWLLDDYQLASQIDIESDPNDINSSTSAGPRRLMLGIHLAERLGVASGERVELFDEPYLVTGVFRSPSTWENGSMIMPLETLQEITDRGNQVTFINVILSNRLSADASDTAIQQIEALDARLLALPTAEFVESDTRMQLAAAMAWMTSVIALVIGTIGTLNTMLTSVFERTREIGILRAIGWSQLRIVGMILGESCGLAVVAGGLGCLFAVLMTWALSHAPAVKGILEPTIDGRAVLQGFALALGIGLLGAILPAWRTARLLPTVAFREL